MDSTAKPENDACVATGPLTALHHGGRRERGVVLALALMTLVILTIIGVTAMNGSVMEVRMAGNIQDANSAFLVAENGLEEVMRNPAGKLIIGGTWTSNPPFSYSLSSGPAQATVSTRDLALSEPGFSSTPGEDQNANTPITNFEIISEGVTQSGTKVKLFKGVYQKGAAVQD